MTHKTDVKQTSDLAGFAAREAGQGWDLGYNKPDGDNDMKIKFVDDLHVREAKHDPATRQFHELFDQAAREASFLDSPTPYIDAEQLKESTRKAVLTPIETDGEVREVFAVNPNATHVGPDGTLHAREAGEEAAQAAKTRSVIWNEADQTFYNGETGEVLLKFPDQHYHVDPEEEAARAARPRTTHEQIESTCNAIRDMLLAKNRKYGDSALDPVRIFSRASAVEQILVRLDDKLSRLRSAQADEDEDVVDDLIGYLVLLKIARAR